MSPPVAEDRLDGVLGRLAPLLGALEGRPQPLDGGITNHNFRVRLGGADYVVRIAGKDTDKLGIDRSGERAATEAAHAAGVAPEVTAFVDGCLVTRFIAGRPIPPVQLRRPATLAEVAASVRAVHAGPPFETSFSAFRIVEAYRETAVAHGAALPAAQTRAAARAAEIEDALRGPDHRPVPCHNDLLNANFIHDGERVRIVDWEYAGMGDRHFDLGNLSVNNDLGEDDDRVLLEAYWRAPPTPARFAALRLMRLMSDYREAMWGVVQAAVSELDVDFHAYAAEHFERLEAGAADPRYRSWLEASRSG